MSAATALQTESCASLPSPKHREDTLKKAALPMPVYWVSKTERFGKERFAAYVCGNTSGSPKTAFIAYHKILQITTKNGSAPTMQENATPAKCQSMGNGSDAVPRSCF